MPTRLWFMLPLLPITAISLGVESVVEQQARATIGLAEWEISTPGGHHIAYIDPLKEKYGVSLRSKTEADLIYVDQIQWWQYYPGLVVGVSAKRVFIFDEVTSRVDYFLSEVELEQELNRRQLQQPVSKRYTPQDGWNEAWLPVIQARCAEVQANPPSEADLESIGRYCDQMRSLGE